MKVGIIGAGLARPEGLKRRAILGEGQRAPAHQLGLWGELSSQSKVRGEASSTQRFFFYVLSCLDGFPVPMLHYPVIYVRNLT